MTITERNLLLKKIETSVYDQGFNCVYLDMEKCECMTCQFLNFSLKIIAKIVGDTGEIPFWESCGKPAEDCPKIQLGKKCSCSHKPRKNKKHCSGCAHQKIPYLYEEDLLNLSADIDDNSMYINNSVSNKIHYAISVLAHIQKRHHNESNETKEEIVKMFLSLAGLKMDAYEINSAKNRERLESLRADFVKNKSLTSLQNKLATTYKELRCSTGYKESFNLEDNAYACFVHILENMIKERSKSIDTDYDLHLFLNKSINSFKDDE